MTCSEIWIQSDNALEGKTRKISFFTLNSTLFCYKHSSHAKIYQRSIWFGMNFSPSTIGFKGEKENFSCFKSKSRFRSSICLLSKSHLFLYKQQGLTAVFHVGFTEWPVLIDTFATSLTTFSNEHTGYSQFTFSLWIWMCNSIPYTTSPLTFLWLYAFFSGSLCSFRLKEKGLSFYCSF